MAVPCRQIWYRHRTCTSQASARLRRSSEGQWHQCLNPPGGMRVVTHAGTHTAMETVGAGACSRVKEIPQSRKPESKKMNELCLGGRRRTCGCTAEWGRSDHCISWLLWKKVREGHKDVFAAVLGAKRSWRKVGEEHTEQLRDERTEDSILQAGQPFKHPSVTVTYSNPLKPAPIFPFSSRDADPLPT